MKAEAQKGQSDETDGCPCIYFVRAPRASLHPALLYEVSYNTNHLVQAVEPSMVYPVFGREVSK